MSNRVVRPKKKTPWVRRIVSSLILLAIVIGLVFLIVKAVSAVTGMLSDHHVKTTESSAPRPVEINPCSADQLQITLEPSETIVSQGRGFQTAVIVENTGEVDCSLNTTDVHVVLTAQSKPGASAETIWSPTECTPEWEKMLLLSPNQTWSGTLKWEGYVYEGCDVSGLDYGGAVPEPGIYILSAQAFEDGKVEKVSIQIT